VKPVTSQALLQRLKYLSWSVILQQDDAIPHSTHCKQQLLKLFHWVLLDHPHYCLDRWSNTRQVPISTAMTKWKQLFTSDCTCNSLFSSMMECLNACQDGANTTTILAIMCKNNTSVKNTCYTECCKDLYSFYGLQNYSSWTLFTLGIGANGKR
jgi:hypothetical protein